MNFEIPKSISFVLFVFLLSACNPKVAQVGSYSIYKKDVECRDAVLNLSQAGETRNLGLTQLVRAYQYAQILKNHGHEVTSEVLSAEANRIKTRSLYPEKLAEIKNACPGDSYDRAYVLPVYVDRFLYFDFFLKDATIQAPSLKKPQSFLEKTFGDPRSFEKIAKAEGMNLSNLSISPYTGLQWQQPNTKGNTISPPQVPQEVSQRLNAEKESQISKEGKKWIEEIIQPLKPGSVSPRIIDSQDTWLVVKYLGASKTVKNSHELKVAVFPKRDFSEWIESETKLVPR